jgi:sigma-B regulation protein RsbU (phosphoserine phosphatase)
MRALIADDDRIATEILSTALKRLNIEVAVANDGGAAWELLAAGGGPSLAIIDWMMPTIDGLELCRRIRQTAAHAHMYVILLTGRDDRKDVVAGLDAGADDYIVKPFDPDELRARVQVGIRVLTLQERLADRVAELQDALTRVKRLQGLLPICSYCKRIRGDDQYWQQVDSYIVEHSDAQFTHGICPPCSQKLMAEIDEERERRT